ncbi:MAG: TetR family transcriptional regulator C-terminal domain-containing protein [Sphingomonadales bacterium]
MSQTGRQTQNHRSRPTRIQEQNQARILEAAEEIFAMHGYSGAVIERIAERAGISKPNLLYYFESKKSLYLKVLEHTVNMWMVPLQALDEAEEPAVAFERYIRIKIDYSRSRPFASKVWANELISGAPHIGPYLQRRLKPLVDDKVRAIRRWIDQGKMDPIDPYHLFILIWAATQTYADFGEQAALVTGKKRLTRRDFDQAADTIVSVILKGAGMK